MSVSKGKVKVGVSLAKVNIHTQQPSELKLHLQTKWFYCCQ